MKIVFIGSSGLVGGHLLSLLINNQSITSIVLINRKNLDVKSTKIEQINIPQLNAKHIDGLNISGDCFICTTGTTIKKAGSKKNFKEVDFDLAYSFGKLGERGNAKSIHLISSKGANSKSRFFYNQVKGDLEAVFKELKIPSIYFYRPSLLIGSRNESRPLEFFGIKTIQFLSPFLPKNIQKDLGTKVLALATLMLELVQASKQGVHYIESNQI